MRILEAPLMFVWYDMIDVGEKPEEYREIKPYWFKRFVDYDPEMYVNKNPIPTYFEDSAPFDTPAKAIFWDMNFAGALEFKQFTHIRFRRGYTKITMLFEIESITIGFGNPKWGAPKDKEVFIIKLGKRIS